MEDLDYRTYDDFDDQQAAPPTDTELAALVRSGDNDAFATLWTRHGSFVGKVARQHGAPSEEVEDLQQEVAIRLLLDLRKNSRDLTDGTRNLAGRIAINTTIDNWRYRSRRPVQLVDEYPDRVFGHTVSAEQVVVDRMSVADLLAIADPDQQAAIRALDLDGFTAAEFFEQTGVPANTARVRAHRGRGKIRAALEASQASDE